VSTFATAAEKFLVEVKSEDEVDDAEVQAKARAAVEWCSHASWHYVLVPDSAITATADLAGLVARFAVTAAG
jgi:type III restriction enzyme